MAHIRVSFDIKVKWIGWFNTEKKFISKGVCCTPAFGSIVPPAGSLIGSCCKVEALCKEVTKEPNFEGSLSSGPDYDMVAKSTLINAGSDLNLTFPIDQEEVPPELSAEVNQLIEKAIKEVVDSCGYPEQSCPDDVKDGKCEKPPEGAYSIMGSGGILPGGAKGICTWEDYLLTETREYDEPAPAPPGTKETVIVTKEFDLNSWEPSQELLDKWGSDLY